MDITQYHATLRTLEQHSNGNLAQLAHWAEIDALPWLWSELAGIIGNRATPMSAADAIRIGLQITPIERGKKPFNKQFYIAHLSMLDAETKRYCGAAKAYNALTKPWAAEATVFNLHTGLKNLLSHGSVLLEQAGSLVIEVPGYYGAWSRRADMPFEVFKGAEQSIYGQFSGLTHLDPAPHIPVSVLRTAIEVRFRSAFGIYTHHDPRNDSFPPINLSDLFDKIRPHLNNIKFNVDFHDTVKIYRWCNAYLHSGWRDFPWVPGFALQYLRPLFSGSQPLPNKRWSINNGIQLSRTVWKDIRSAFVPRLTWKHRFPSFLLRLIGKQYVHKAPYLPDFPEDSAACHFTD